MIDSSLVVPEQKNTHERILQAAAEVFAKKGYRGATTKEIAREAGVAEVTLFRHFGTKKDLLFAVLVPAFTDSVVRTCKEMLEQGNGDVIRAVIADRIHAARTRPELFRLMLHEIEFQEDVGEEFYAIYLDVSQVVEQYIQKKMDEGVFRKGDARFAAHFVFSAVLGYQFLFDLYGIRRMSLSESETVDKLVEIIESGLIAGPHR